MKTVEKQPTKKKMDELDWSMWRWQAVIIVLGILLLVGYAIAFSSSANLGGDHGQEKWGQFGDFIGGIMNPLVAFAAFYWLTQSVKLQKQELAETREELAKSADAQRQQAASGNMAVRVAAMTALVNSAESQIKPLEDRLRGLPVELQSYRAQNDPLYRDSLQREHEAIVAALDKLKAHRSEFYTELNAFLKEPRTGILGE